MTERPRIKRVLLYDEPLPAGEPDRLPAVAFRSEDELSRIEERFCLRWTTHYDTARAAIEAGYIPSRAHWTGRNLLKDPRIKRRVVAIEGDRLRRMRFDGDTFLAQEIIRATALVSELVELWIPPCRHCYGTNFEYQRTYAEFYEAYEAWMRLPSVRRRRTPGSYDFGYGQVLTYDESGGKIPFDQMGGDGYDVSQPPNPACPNCRGRGLEVPGVGSVAHIVLKDTRELSDAGRLLFAGVKHTPRGVEVITASQDAARARLMGMLGRFLELRAEGQIPPALADAGQPAIGFGIGVTPSVAGLITSDPRSLSDSQLDVLLASYGVTDRDIEPDGPAREGAAGGGDTREAPPPGRVA